MGIASSLKKRISYPIVPGEAIAGIYLGVDVSEIYGFIETASRDESFFGTVSYRLKIPYVSIGVHARSSRVFRISAYPGYVGKLFDRYRPGQPIQLLIDDPEWFFSEEHGLMLNTKFDGVAASICLDDPDYNDLPGKDIYEISVFVKNIDAIDRDWEE